jgi:D-hydroxyproline dehydrogenase subunit gamma
MPERFSMRVNGSAVEVVPGMTVAVALMAAGRSAVRKSVNGLPRGPLCGMGICFECRVTVDGEAHVKGCQALCRPGMEVEVDEL